MIEEKNKDSDFYLLPCPFCGSDDLRLRYSCRETPDAELWQGEWYQYSGSILCRNCGLHKFTPPGIGRTKEEGFLAARQQRTISWNTRNGKKHRASRIKTIRACHGMGCLLRESCIRWTPGLIYENICGFLREEYDASSGCPNYGKTKLISIIDHHKKMTGKDK
jgi:hypothetical protein